MKKTKFFILILILLILAVGVNSVILNNSYNQQIQAYNEQVYALIGTIKQNYPEVSDEEIIKILNNNTNSAFGKELAQKYGITENDPAILKLEEIQNNTIIYSSAIIGILNLAIVVIWLVSRIIQKRKIDGITKYIREINNKKYDLKIKENAEDELSN